MRESWRHKFSLRDLLVQSLIFICGFAYCTIRDTLVDAWEVAIASVPGLLIKAAILVLMILFVAFDPIVVFIIIALFCQLTIALEAWEWWILSTPTGSVLLGFGIWVLLGFGFWMGSIYFQSH